MGKIEVQAIGGVARAAYDILLVGDEQVARAVGREREDAGPIVVARSFFEEAGIDAAALDFLEDDAALDFVDGHGFAKGAVNIKAKADDGLAVEEGQNEGAFKGTGVGVAENEIEG